MSVSLIVCCLLLGVVCGLRSMTAPAAVAWGAHLGWLHFAGTHLAFIQNKVTWIVFTLLALGELFADKLPQAPARTAPPGLIARVVFGAACAGALAVGAGQVPVLSVLSGVAGSIIGTFGGYNIRRALTTGRNLPDFPVALVEDIIAVAGAFLIVSHV
jgi:uncharacterized membrane protein